MKNPCAIVASVTVHVVIVVSGGGSDYGMSSLFICKSASVVE